MNLRSRKHFVAVLAVVLVAAVLVSLLLVNRPLAYASGQEMKQFEIRLLASLKSLHM